MKKYFLTSFTSSTLDHLVYRLVIAPDKATAEAYVTSWVAKNLPAAPFGITVYDPIEEIKDDVTPVPPVFRITAFPAHGLKLKFGTVDPWELSKFTDDELLKAQGVGKMFLHRLRRFVEANSK